MGLNNELNADVSRRELFKQLGPLELVRRVADAVRGQTSAASASAPGPEEAGLRLGRKLRRMAKEEDSTGAAIEGWLRLLPRK